MALRCKQGREGRVRESCSSKILKILLWPISWHKRMKRFEPPVEYADLKECISLVVLILGSSINLLPNGDLIG